MTSKFLFLFSLLIFQALPVLAEKTKVSLVFVADSDEDCDSTKFPDFKSNLRFTTSAIEPKIAKTIDSIARVYFENLKITLPEDEKEAGYLDTLIPSSTAHYFSSAGAELFAFGYIVHSDHSDFEANEASFFIVGAKKDGKIIAMDILHDIDGAILLQIKGFEYLPGNEGVVIWGKTDALLAEGYGRFKLTISKESRSCEYECKFSE